jgi:hypothetical protein
MQTKLKPILFLVTLAVTASLVYAANDTGTKQPSIGLFNVSVLSPQVISINPRLGRSEQVLSTVETLKDTVYEKPDTFLKPH